MQNHPFFLFKNVVRIPYYMAENNHFKVNFDFTDNSFNIFTTQDLAFSNFDSIRLEFDFCFILDQLVDFEANEELEMLVFSCASPAPPYHCFSELIAHSLIRQDFVVKAGSRLGKLKILSLNTKVKFVPLQIPKRLIFKLAKKSEILRTFDLRKDISDTLAKLLLLKENNVQQLAEGNLFDKKSRQIHVNMLAQKADVSEENIPRGRKNQKFVKYEDLIDKLNSIVLGQFLIPK